MCTGSLDADSQTCLPAGLSNWSISIGEQECESSDSAQLVQGCLSLTLAVPSKEPEQKGSLSKRAGLRRVLREALIFFPSDVSTGYLAASQQGKILSFLWASFMLLPDF